MSKIQAQKLYKKHTPLHGKSAQHKRDMEAIAKASNPTTHAEKLIDKRRTEIIEGKVEAMLRDHQGSHRKRFAYNQEAAIGLEHLQQDPLDPITQVPLWHDLIRKTAKGATVSKQEFMKVAQAILSQTSLYSPDAL